MIDGVVGFIEVGGEDEEGAGWASLPVELLLEDGGEDEGAGAPLAGGGEMFVVAEAACHFGNDGGTCDWR